MAREHPARSTRQQLKRVAQATENLGRCQRFGPRGGEFDGQWDSVEPIADLGDRRRVGGRDGECWTGVASAVAEQRDGIEPDQIAKLSVDAGLGCRQRRYPPHDLARNAERTSAGGENADVGAQAKDRVGELGAGIEHVLAVVENHQRAIGVQSSGDDLGGIS